MIFTRKTLEVRCDGDGCRWNQYASASTKQAAEKEVRLLGWRVIDGRHYCPVCADRMAREEADEA